MCGPPTPRVLATLTPTVIRATPQEEEGQEPASPSHSCPVLSSRGRFGFRTDRGWEAFEIDVTSHTGTMGSTSVTESRTESGTTGTVRQTVPVIYKGA